MRRIPRPDRPKRETQAALRRVPPESRRGAVCRAGTSRSEIRADTTFAPTLWRRRLAPRRPRAYRAAAPARGPRSPIRALRRAVRKVRGWRRRTRFGLLRVRETPFPRGFRARPTQTRLSNARRTLPRAARASARWALLLRARRRLARLRETRASYSPLPARAVPRPVSRRLKNGRRNIR